VFYNEKASSRPNICRGGSTVELKFFLTGPNTLAYFAGASLAKKKRFMTLTQNIFFDAKKKEIEFDYATFLQRSKQFQRQNL